MRYFILSQASHALLDQYRTVEEKNYTQHRNLEGSFLSAEAMAPNKRRKVAPRSGSEDRDLEGGAEGAESQGAYIGDKPQEHEESVTLDTGAASADKTKNRQERFKALQARAVSLGPIKSQP